MTYDDILTTATGPVLTLTINRPDAGNKFRHQTCLELFDALQRFRLDRELGPRCSPARGRSSSASAASTTP